LSALQQQAELWHSQGRVSGYLLTGEALEQAEQWAADHPNVLSDVDRAFLTDSQEQRTLQAAERREQELIATQRIAEEAQARQHAEEAARLEAERRVADQVKATRRSRILSGVAVVAALIAGALGLVARDRAADADNQRANAEAAATRAQELGLTANSLWRAEQALHEPDPRTGLLLSVEALNNDDTPEAKRALLQRVVEVPGASRIWPDPVATLEAGVGEIRGVAFSHDGERLVAGDQIGKVTLWRPSGADSTIEMSVGAADTVAKGAVRSITFAPNDLSIAIAGDGGVRLLDPSSLANRTTISEKAATSVAYLPKSDAIVFGNADGSVNRFKLASTELVELEAPTDGGGIAVNAVAVSSRGWVAAGRDDGSVLLWNAAGGRFLLEPPPMPGGTPAGGAMHPASISCITFDRLGTRLAAGDSQGAIWQWELDLSSQSIAARDPLKHSDVALIDLSYVGSGTTMTATDEGGHVVLWDIEREEKITEDALNPDTRSVTFAPLGGPLVVSGGANGELYLWSQVLTLFSSKEPFVLDATDLGAVAFSPVGDQFALGRGDGNVQLCDRVAMPTPCETKVAGLGRISSLAVSNNGQLLASGDSRGTIVVHNLEENREVLSLSAGSHVTSLAFSADDQQLVVGAEVPEIFPATGSIEVFELNALQDHEQKMATPTGDLIAGLEFLKSNSLGIVHGLTIDPDVQRIAVAGSNGIAWSTRNGTLVRQDRATDLKTWSVEFSPDGNQIASGSQDGRIYLWDTENPSTRPSVLGRLNSAVVALKWLDPETLIAVGGNGLVIEFSLNPQTLKLAACEVAGRDFESAEARRLFDQDVYQACAAPAA
ncbi:MAG: hypothetical protein K0R44_419, partial [Thermomicrobiales bacterium]|nr:hypothetical protein [Thermomicrobiales bacterium]